MKAQRYASASSNPFDIDVEKDTPIKLSPGNANGNGNVGNVNGGVQDPELLDSEYDVRPPHLSPVMPPMRRHYTFAYVLRI